MYQASKKFGDAIAGSNRKFNTRLLENEKVLVESVKNFTITSGAEEITIGSAVASYVQATIENKGIALSGKEVSLEIGVEVDGDMEYIPMGLYTIQNPKIESNKVTFTAYDRLASRCNGAYYSQLGYPVDAVDILAEISTMTGMAIDISTLQRGIQINQRAIIEEGDYNEETEESEVITTYVNPFDGYTYKETIGFIAGLFGKFAICGRTGMIEFRWYQGIDYEIPSNIFYNDLQETEESFSIKRLTCDNSDQTLSSGSGATGISMQNPVMTQGILDGVYNTVQGLVFTPAALRFIGDMRLDIGDIVTAVKNDVTKFTIPIISLITSYDGGLMQTIASYGNTAEEDDSDTKGPITEMAERVEYELAFVKKLMVDNLTATNATIKNLSGDVLKFKTGEFENLKSDVASFKETTTTNLNAANAKIENLEANTVKTSELEAKVGTFGYLKATDASLTYATITNLKAESGKIDDLQSDYATFKTATANDLKAANANIQNLTATKATITDLNAATAKISILEGNYANLNTLVNGNLTSANIQSLTLNSKNTTIENGMIKNAMIENLAFDKITGMDINTTNLTVHSSDGKSKWSDNTIQISDANRVRVQIGKDASNDYSMSVWDKNGNLIWDALGATEKTIQRKIIRDGIVADDANISGSKLDINSVIKEVNGSTTKLKSSTIVMNDKNQTLDVVFNEMETTVADNLSSAKLYADGKLSDAQKYALEQANSALSSAKSYADSAVDNIEIGGRNLLTKDDCNMSKWQNLYPAHCKVTNNDYSNHIDYVPTGGEWEIIYKKISVTKGQKYILSFDYKVNKAYNYLSGQKYGVYLSTSVPTNAAPANIITNGQYVIENTVTNIKRGMITFTATVDTLYIVINGDCIDDNQTGLSFEFNKWKLEKGSKATDWTPAPEDTQSQIDNITEITTSHTTSISTMQGQISSLISEDTTIKGNYDALLSRYNATVNTVDSMKTTIGEHTTILNSQNDSIVAVTTKANTIESNLAGTTQTVSEVKSNLAGTQERVTKVETSLTGLTTRVSSTETNLANLEIGGRNLVLRSKDFTSGDDYWYINGNYRKSIDDDGFTVVSISRSGAGLEWNRIIPHAFIPVEEMHRGIIVSFDFMCDKVSELDRGCICALQTYNSGGGRIGWYESQDILSGTQCKLSAPLSDGKWIRVQVPFSEGNLKKTYGSSNAVAYTSVSLQLVSNGSIHFKKVKIEYGSKATDYTEAPEDVDQQITAVETIASQTADKFSWLVKSGTNSTDFELTDKTATLVASAINMNGLVTFNGLSTDAKNGILNSFEVGGRNLALNTSNSYSTAFTSFSGVENTCFGLGQVTCKGIAIGDVVTVHLYIKYTDIVPASGQTARIWIQGSGNITAWSNGEFGPSEHKSISGSGEFEFLYSFTMSSAMYINTYWNCALRTDYIASGSIQYKDFKVEKGNKVTDWTPAPEDYLPQANLVSNWTTNSTWIDGGKIYTGSITADKIATDAIRSKNYVANSTGSFLNLADGSFDSKYLKWDASGKISATGGKVGKYEITDTYLKTGSGSTCSGFGSDYAFWAGNDEAKYAPFKVEYDGTLNIEHIVVHGDQEDIYMKIGKDFLTIQDVNTSAHFGLDGFDFAWANSRIRTGDQGIELYGDTPYIDFHYNNSYADYTSRIIAQSNWDCLSFTGSILLGGYIYNSSNGHYTWDGRTDAYLGCGNYNNTNNIYYYAGYHAFYVNGDSGSGMMYIETSGVSSRKGFRNSSDERIKKDFKHFDDDFINSYMQLEPVKYRFKDDSDDKYHIGFKAQNVDKTLNAYGKKYDEQFGICITSHINPDYAKKAYGIENMNEVYTLAYDELIGANTFMIQKTRKDLLYQAGKIDIHEAIINDLQFKIAKMEKKIEQLTKALA